MPKKGKKKDAAAEKEAEEAKRLAEEERVRDEERARKERDVNESKYKDRCAAFFNQEKERIQTQISDLAYILEQKKQQLQLDLASKNNELEWTRYLECSVLPSPKIERDLNTYLMLWREEPLQFDEVPSLSTMYQQLPNALKLLQQLQIEKGELIDNGNKEKADKIHSYIVDLIDIIIRKWDMTTQQILQFVDVYARESTENFQIEGEQDGFKYGLWANLTKNPRHKVVEFSNTGMVFTVAKPLGLDNVGIRMICTHEPGMGAAYDIQEGPERLSHIGGIMYFDLVELPETPKKVDKWIIRPLLSQDGSVKRIEYPFKKNTESEEEAGIVQDNAVWLIQLSYSMQPHCIIDKSARIMYWDAVDKKWSQDGIKDQEFDSETGKLRFRTMQFAPHALCQNAYLELPYKDWHLEPVQSAEFILSITGQVNEIKIAIREGSCRLIGNLAENHPSLQNPQTPSIFFNTLAHIGLNFIGPTSGNNVDVGDWVVKHSKVERGCIDGICCFADRFKFKRSSSNGAVSFSKCVFQCQELETAEWKSIVYNADFKSNEESIPVAFIPHGNHIDDDTRFYFDGNETKTINSTVYHVLSTLGQASNASTHLQKTVSEVLQITRLLAFS